MRRGSTPTHSFVLPMGEDDIKKVEITYCQDGKIVLQKGLYQSTIEGNVLSVTLSQADTFEFAENTSVEIQVRVLTNDDCVFVSNILCVPCDKCLSSEVLI